MWWSDELGCMELILGQMRKSSQTGGVGRGGRGPFETQKRDVGQAGGGMAEPLCHGTHLLLETQWLFILLSVEHQL